MTVFSWKGVIRQASFTYTVVDEHGSWDRADVTFTIRTVRFPPPPLPLPSPN
jgi:hypothetical protein